MKKILVIKTGSTFPSLMTQKGDFEDWVLSGMGIGRDSALIIDVRRGFRLPEYSEISAAVITGSHEMVTEHQECIDFCREEVIACNHDHEALIEQTEETSYGSEILKRFLGIITQPAIL